MRLASLAAVALGALLGVCATARADIVVLDTSRDAAAPGERVHVTIGCGGCPAKGLDLPVSLVPVARGERHPCRGTSCAWAAPEAPTEPPYLPLGTSSSEARSDINSLDFEVPDAAPGLYTYVIFCEPCYAGRAGSLIGHPSARRPVVLGPGEKRLGSWFYLRIRSAPSGLLDSVLDALRDLLPGL